MRLATAAARNVDARNVARAVYAALELGITVLEAAEEEAGAVRGERVTDDRAGVRPDELADRRVASISAARRKRLPAIPA